MRRSIHRTTGLLIVLAAAAPAQPLSDPSFRGEMLAAHNAVRFRVRVPPLEWSDRLADRAREWASALLARGQFRHSPNSPFGENLFEIRGAAASPAEVVRQWATESRDYDYRTNRCRGVCGHYTQLVWRDTRDVGCGVAGSGTREVWVCVYDPPGNWIGKKPY